LQAQKKMKATWDEIPSLEGLKVEWNYEPENPLGRRSTVRLLKKDLFRMLEVDNVPVQIVAKKFNDRGLLVDISTNGLAILLNDELKAGTVIRVGFFLGKHKILSRGIVRNTSAANDKQRIGIEFVELSKEHTYFIACLNSSKIYRS